MVEWGDANRLLVRKLEAKKKNGLGDLGIYSRITLEWIFKRYD
jgi:hypothetical protein